MSVSRLYTGAGSTWIETNYALPREDNPSVQQSRPNTPALKWIPLLRLDRRPLGRPRLGESKSRDLKPNREVCYRYLPLTLLRSVAKLPTLLQGDAADALLTLGPVKTY